jgi:hypothetical protein
LIRFFQRRAEWCAVLRVEWMDAVLGLLERVRRNDCVPWANAAFDRRIVSS